MKQTLYHIYWNYVKPLSSESLRNQLNDKKKILKEDHKNIESLQLLKIQRLVHHAYYTTKFYKEHFDKHNISPSQIKNIDDFKRIPPITKEIIRTRIEDFISTDYSQKRLTEIFSGGSTGVPTKVYNSDHLSVLNQVQFMYFLPWMHVRWGDKIAYIWGLNNYNKENELDKFISKKKPFKNFVVMDAFNLTNDKMKSFAEFLQCSYKPRLIIGYASALVTFANFVQKNSIRLPFLKAIQSTAEMLYEEQRTFIQDVFNVPVFNQYGSTEIQWIAAECKVHDGLHIFEDIRYVESRNIMGTNLEELIVTDLENYSCPLIRYLNEDLGRVINEPCKCGNSMKRIKDIKGRISDIFTLKNGKRIHGEYFTHIFYLFKDQLKKFQVHQIDIDNIIIRVALNDNNSLDKTLFQKEVVKKLSQETSTFINYKFEYVNDIKQEQSGKYRFTKSEVNY